MIFSNDRILKDMIASLFREFGTNGLIEKVEELEKRLDLLENPIPKKRGRPAKVLNG